MPLQTHEAIATAYTFLRVTTCLYLNFNNRAKILSTLIAVIREFKQVATAGAATATGSKIVQKRVMAHVSCSHLAGAGNPSTAVGRF